jgi:hypothetical protein
MHPVLRSIFGWGAWFDDGSKTDVPCYKRNVGDYVIAGIHAGLTLRGCEEPTIPQSQLMAIDDQLGTRTAYEGIPMVLVLVFER